MTAALARRLKLQVSATGVDGTWLPFGGINDLSPNIDPNIVSADDYDTNGFSGFEVTMQAWDVTLKAMHQLSAGAFTPGQELVRATRLQFGDAARVFVRWFDRFGLPEAYSGKAIPVWSSSKTGVADLDEIAVKFTGDGILTPITNPFNAAAIPVVTSAISSPAAQIAGGLVQVNGSGFAGATSVKFGAVTATEVIYISDSALIAKMPTGSAGSAPITVINAAGTSNALGYVRGA